jgi:hypothetical protein
VPNVVITGTRPIDDPLHREVRTVWIRSHVAFVKLRPQGRHIVELQRPQQPRRSNGNRHKIHS